MTEREFDQKVERAAANFERRVEATADHLDKTVNHAWNHSRLFRCASRGIFPGCGGWITSGCRTPGGSRKPNCCGVVCWIKRRRAGR